MTFNLKRISIQYKRTFNNDLLITLLVQNFDKTNVTNVSLCKELTYTHNI